LKKPIKKVRTKEPPLDAEKWSKSFPIVGIGASAGGLEAFIQLLKHLPDKNGMAFVLVQHLDPKHESRLTELLARVTKMEVSEAKNNGDVEQNHVYIIPPNSDMEIKDGALKIHQRRMPGGQHMPIDVFFRSLAIDQQSKAIGIILSGTGSDGTLGCQEIKERG